MTVKLLILATTLGLIAAGAACTRGDIYPPQADPVQQATGVAPVGLWRDHEQPRVSAGRDR